VVNIPLATVSNAQRRMLASGYRGVMICETTRTDTDWVPFEISYAVDNCNLPIIVTYLNTTGIIAPSLLWHKWPDALRTRILEGRAKAVHIPFEKEKIKTAIERYNINCRPATGFDVL
jgi:hypothetical protein